MKKISSDNINNNNNNNNNHGSISFSDVSGGGQTSRRQSVQSSCPDLFNDNQVTEGRSDGGRDDNNTEDGGWGRTAEHVEVLYGRLPR